MFRDFNFPFLDLKEQHFDLILKQISENNYLLPILEAFVMHPLVVFWSWKVLRINSEV